MKENEVLHLKIPKKQHCFKYKGAQQTAGNSLWCFCIIVPPVGTIGSQIVLHTGSSFSITIGQKVVGVAPSSFSV